MPMLTRTSMRDNVRRPVTGQPGPDGRAPAGTHGKEKRGLRHAILVAGLAAAFMVPAAMLSMHWLPVSRWRLDVPGRGDLNDPDRNQQGPFATANEPDYRSSSLEHSAPAIVPREEMRLDRVLPPMSPRRWTSGPSSLGQLNWLRVPDERFMASGLLAVWLFGATVKVTGLVFSLIRLRRIVARRVPVSSDHVLSILVLIHATNSDAEPAAFIGERGSLRPGRGGRHR